jgi:ubiquinol-cytochrome c reductase cytochrome b subunit
MAVKTATGAPAPLSTGVVAEPATRRFWAWLNKRLPVDEFINSQMTGYLAPKNFNIWYFFGSLALAVLVLQLLSGIYLTMFYKVGETTSFDSVEFIMREVNYGWLIRYLHSTGASAFFIVVYLHMYRALLYGSYRPPRELLWLIGMLVYLALMAEAFMGYVLPWGNMSFWGAQVIVNLFGTIPGIGPGLVEWIRGDYGIADATLNRFFALHVALIPLGLLLLVALHLTVLFAIVVFFVPTLGGLFLESANFEPANPLSTPEHIAPVWYFTPYYAILRAVPDQRLGALLMLLAVSAFLFLPWLDRSPVKSIRYKGWMSRTALALFTVAFIALGYLGLQPAEGLYVVLARLFTVIYFLFFLLMPFYTKLDPVKPVPERVVYHAH